MRFAGRLARLVRRAALLPPRDPLEGLKGAEIVRASKVIKLLALDERWFPQGKPALAAADAAWFEAAIRPLLPAYAAFCAKMAAWERRMDPPRGAFARIAEACNFPAFAGRPRPEIRLPSGLIEKLLAAAPA